jgi:hypothetical protein
MAEPAAGELAERNSIRLRYKIIAYVGAGIAALLLTAPGLWPLAWMFPLGLLAVFDRHLANPGGWGVLTGCYAIYVVHGFFFRSRTTARTLILYAVLPILLLGNVAGCREMMHTH